MIANINHPHKISIHNITRSFPKRRSGINIHIAVDVYTASKYIA
jgi:hypothetical protein